ncbi:MAG: TnsD family Tn7-like transposition protein [Pseudomonas sp.]|uniref:TnsD family Tn7-like transposition protein n=1 Tax=Pseudomonas sp. TaxID=306 RepID=UPI003BB595C3
MRATARFPFFPSPERGETVYSWVTRYHLLSGHRSFVRHTLPLLGLASGRPANEFPSYLPQLASAAGVDVLHIIRDMTSYKYYGAFLSGFDHELLLASLKTGDTQHLQNRLGCVANRITPGQSIYSCRFCVQADIDRLGFPVWHIEHQLAGVVVCPIHHEHLHATSRLHIQAELPGAEIETESTAVEEKYSVLVLDEFRSPSHGVCRDSCYQAYQVRLRELGLTTSQGRLRERSLRALLNEHLKDVSQGHPVFAYLLSQVQAERFPECLFYANMAFHHPIKHLVLIEALFAGWGQFVEVVNSLGSSVTCDPLREQGQAPAVVLSPESADLLRHGVSLRIVSVQAGTTVTTLKILAQQAGISVNLRPKKITSSIERAIWRKLIVGEKTTDIAPLFCLSVAAVEQILRKHPGLILLRKRVWFFRDRRKHRTALKAYRVQHPDKGRQELRAALGATYCWLYTHDRLWLSSELPKRKQAIYRPRKAMR